MIEKARKRSPYPRPWGIDIRYTRTDEEEDGGGEENADSQEDDFSTNSI